MQRLLNALLMLLHFFCCWQKAAGTLALFSLFAFGTVKVRKEFEMKSLY